MNIKKNETLEKLVKLRKGMQESNVDVYIITTDDYHMSEYAGEYFEGRKYVSGFTGSAGTLVITLDEAVLFTDGRYFVQAEMQLEGSSIKLMKMGNEGVPTLTEYCESVLKENGTIGIDGRTIDALTGKQLEKAAQRKCGKVNDTFDYVAKIWEDRPDFPYSEAYDVIVGEETKDKITRLRKEISKNGADSLVVTKLDDICWLFNIRGNDVWCNPVIMSYAYVSADKTVLYADKTRFTDKTLARFKTENVEILPYDAIYEELKKIKAEKVLLDLSDVNLTLYNLIKENNTIVEEENPIVLMKSIKNPVEIKNLRDVHIDDGACVTKFINWVKKSVKKYEESVDNNTDCKCAPVTEASAAEYIDNLRSQVKDYIELSFDTISAYGPNAAMMHYHADEKTSAVLKSGGMLLVDSGGQYYRGTTDVTRTISLGNPTEEMKKHFTLALKGMLNLSDAHFLHGCRGYVLDILARGPLWNEGVDYRCGTGHGVGYLLNVHESPNGFRWKYTKGNPMLCVMEPGMVTSNEPGVYVDGEYGIRIENEIICENDYENEYGTWLKFGTLTCAPIDLDLVEPSLMTEKEKDLLNEYHKWVFKELSEMLQDDDLEYLKEATREIK